MSPTDLHVVRWGAGPPVLFLHGLGASSRYWERLVQATDGYAGVAPDLLGFGRSPKPSDSAFGVDDHLAAIERVTPPGAVAVGHSAGAILAAALARRRADVRGLLLPACPRTPTMQPPTLRSAGSVGSRGERSMGARRHGPRAG